MPAWLLVAIAVFIVAIIVLAVAGNAYNRRYRARTDADLLTRVRAADNALAEAAADDHGWDRGVLDEAARAAFAAQHPGLHAANPVLVLVDDRPGTEEDRAVFEVRDGGRRLTATLLRHGDRWRPESPPPVPGA